MKKIILLADDEITIRDVTRRILEDFHFDVIEASNGIEVIERFSEDPDKISLIILDIMMPKLSGFDAYKIIRSENKDIPILLSSGYLLDAIMLEENTYVLRKPYSIDDLKQSLDTIFKD